MSAVATVADHTPKADNRSSDDRWHPRTRRLKRSFQSRARLYVESSSLRDELGDEVSAT